MKCHHCSAEAVRGGYCDLHNKTECMLAVIDNHWHKPEEIQALAGFMSGKTPEQFRTFAKDRGGRLLIQLAVNIQQLGGSDPALFSLIRERVKGRAARANSEAA